MSAVSSAPSVTFLGAARSVGGSMHLVEYAGRRILLDCGQARGFNGAFPFDPASIDAVVLSHAHTDHCGALPSLVKAGFTGPIYCTPPTRDLAELMLLDAARKHEEWSADRSGATRPQNHTRAMAYQTAEMMELIDYAEPLRLPGGAVVTFQDAGHILGSASVQIVFPDGERLHFTGDLGRYGVPMLTAPQPLPSADLVICESTYGGREHKPIAETVERLFKIVRDTAERGGKVIVPAFSLGRTQLILHTLLGGRREGRIPPIPLYMDTPLGQNITEVHREFQDWLAPDAANDPQFLAGQGLHYPENSAASERISRASGPSVIVASSGMCEGGRVVHHLANHLDDPRVSVVMVSFQAPNTGGKRLLEKGPTVRLGQHVFNKWAEVHELQGFSGHADRPGFVQHFGPRVHEQPAIRLVHGDLEAAEALAKALAKAGFENVEVPEPGERVAVKK